MPALAGKSAAHGSTIHLLEVCYSCACGSANGMNTDRAHHGRHHVIRPRAHHVVQRALPGGWARVASYLLHVRTYKGVCSMSGLARWGMTICSTLLCQHGSWLLCRLSCQDAV